MPSVFGNTFGSLHARHCIVIETAQHLQLVREFIASQLYLDKSYQYYSIILIKKLVGVWNNRSWGWNISTLKNHVLENTPLVWAYWDCNEMYIVMPNWGGGRERGWQYYKFSPDFFTWFSNTLYVCLCVFVYLCIWVFVCLCIWVFVCLCILNWASG